MAHLPPLPKLDDLPDGLVEKVRDLPMELVRTPNSTSTLPPPIQPSFGLAGGLKLTQWVRWLVAMQRRRLCSS